MVADTLEGLPLHYFSDDSPCRVFTVYYVEHKCTKLKCRKAAGWDGVFHEHLKYGGHTMHKALQILFNPIVKYKIVPKHLTKSVIVPIRNIRETMINIIRTTVVLPVNI